MGMDGSFRPSPARAIWRLSIGRRGALETLKSAGPPRGNKTCWSQGHFGLLGAAKYARGGGLWQGIHLSLVDELLTMAGLGILKPRRRHRRLE